MPRAATTAAAATPRPIESQRAARASALALKSAASAYDLSMTDAPEPRGVLLEVSYDGTPFSGFARQPNARTVAGELDGAVRVIDPGASLVRGASRTDAGVHALAQPVSFDTRRNIEPRGWVLALLSQLP